MNEHMLYTVIVSFWLAFCMYIHLTNFSRLTVFVRIFSKASLFASILWDQFSTCPHFSVLLLHHGSTYDGRKCDSLQLLKLRLYFGWHCFFKIVVLSLHCCHHHSRIFSLMAENKWGWEVLFN